MSGNAIYLRQSVAGLDGLPLNNGKVYVGAAGLDPETHPISCYWDSGLTQPAAQPLGVSAGYVVNSGARAAVYVAEESFSLRIRDHASQQVDYQDTVQTALTKDVAAARYGESVQASGALGDNSTDDGPAFNTAYANAVGSALIVPPKTFVIRPTNTSPYYDRNLTGNLVYRAVVLNRSNMNFVGAPGASIHIKSRTLNTLSADVQFAFATDKPLTDPTVFNLGFFGLRYDPGNDADHNNSNQRLGYFVGVNGLRLRDIHAESSEARRGYTVDIDNSKNILITDYLHKNITGGVNWRYCTNLLVANVIADDFSELFDSDSVNVNFVTANVVGNSTTNGGTTSYGQVFDVNSAQNGIIANVAMQHVGNVVTVNYKTTTQGNYAAYVGGAVGGLLGFVPGKDLIFSNFVIQDTCPAANNGGGVPFYIGWDWSAGSHSGEDPVRDITFDNIRVRDAGNVTFLIREAKNLQLSKVHLRNVTTQSGFAAIHGLTSTANNEQIAWTDLEVDILDSSIIGANREGIYLTTPRSAMIRGTKLKSLLTTGGSYYLNLDTIHKRGARIWIDDCDIHGSVRINGDSTTVGNWATSTNYYRNTIIKNGSSYYRQTFGTADWTSGNGVTTPGVSAASGGGPTGTGEAITDGTCIWEYLGKQAYAVRWGLNNRVTGNVDFQGDAHKHVFGVTENVHIGDVAATGEVKHIAYIAQRRCYIARASITTATDVPASGTNYRSIAFKSVVSGVTNTIASASPVTTVAGWTAFAAIDGNFSAIEANAYLEKGDILYIDITSAGTGQALTDLHLTFEMLPL